MQVCSSKNTSVNTKRLPRVYNLLDWNKLFRELWQPGKPKLTVYDYGCGREISHIQAAVNSKGFDYFGYDKSWYPSQQFPENLENAGLIICSNVLNVIDSSEEIKRIQRMVRSAGVPWFITVHEGDKSGISRVTKEDCFQHNLPLEHYIFSSKDVIHHRVLTSEEYKKYVL